MFPSVFGGLALQKLGTGWREAGDFLNGGPWRSSPQHLEQLELNRYLRGLPMRSRPDDRYIRGIVKEKELGVRVFELPLTQASLRQIHVESKSF